MTVYFVRSIRNPDQVKIGHTADDLETRLHGVASTVDGGIELVAVSEGGAEAEKAFHSLFADSRIEGEWFQTSDLLELTVERLSSNVTGRRIFGRVRVIDATGTAIERDRQLAREALAALLPRMGTMLTGVAQARACDVLRSINPLWHRRRVRAIWESKAIRIDLYEYRDLQTALAMSNAQIAAIRADAERGAPSGSSGRLD